MKKLTEIEILRDDIIKTLNGYISILYEKNRVYPVEYQQGFKESFYSLSEYLNDALVKENNLYLLEEKNLGTLIYLTTFLLPPVDSKWNKDYITGYRDAYYLLLEYLADILKNEYL